MERQLGSDKGPTPPRFTTIIVASMEVAAWSPTSGQGQVSTATSNHAGSSPAAPPQPAHQDGGRHSTEIYRLGRGSRVGIDVARRITRPACPRRPGPELLGSVAGLKTETSLRSCA